MKPDMVNRIIFTVVLSLILSSSFGQNLYPEKFSECVLNTFCLDCGDTKAEPPSNFAQELIKNFDSQTLLSITGTIEIQILVDSVGKPCLLSADNKTNFASNKIQLQKSINSTSLWTPAVDGSLPTQSSVSLILIFDRGMKSIQRRTFDPENASNMEAVGTPEENGTPVKDLSETWSVFKQENSLLPWDMTRAVVNDLDNNIWIGTDNGIVRIHDNDWKLFTSTDILSNGKKTPAVRDIAVDKLNNKWFIAEYDVYKYDNTKWTKYDSLNSPINWARNVYVDNSNNVWFTSWDGLVKFDGTKWSVLNIKNSPLSTNKTSGVYVDSKNRLWIGTYGGNLMIDRSKTTKFGKSSPLTKAAILQAHEDRSGNLWFNLYDDEGENAGIYILKQDSKWDRIIPPTPKMFFKNSINYFLLDEDKHFLWITLNNVGILKYDLNKRIWEIYTNENSNVPSVNIEKLALDKNGAIWAATYAGIIKLNINNVVY